MENNNKTSRTFVNIIGIPSLLFIIWYGKMLFLFLIGAVMLIGASELLSLSKIKGANPFGLILYIGLLGICSCYFLDTNYILPWIIIVFILSMSIEIFRSSKSRFLNISFISLGMIWLGLLIGSMIYIRFEYGFIITLAMFLSIWTCDTFAFFFGKNFGNKKILPNISPKKTWLGSLAGLLGSILCLLIFYYGNYFPEQLNLFNIIILSIIYGFFGQLGDFAESAFKRDIGVKDSGDFLKGHGGVLDRFDSLSFAAPLTLMYLMSLGI